jgi:hypothetical protein
MPGLVAGSLSDFAANKTWMAGTSPAMTIDKTFVMPGFRPGIHVFLWLRN